MKKSLYLILLMTIFVVGSVEANASSGKLRAASIKTCGGVTYGQHGSDDHWHIANNTDNGWYPDGDAIYYSDPCSSNNNSTSNNSSNDSSSNNTSSNNSSNDSSSNNSESGSVTNNNVSSNNNSNTGTSSNNSSSSSNNNTSTIKPNSSSSSNANSFTEKEEVKSNDNTLKVIIIDGTEVNIEDNIDYSTTKESVTIKATPNDKKAKYEIKNNSNLEIGDNKILIEVTAEDGTTKIYNINIKRDKILNSDTSINIKINKEEVKFVNNEATVYVSANETNIKVDYTLSDKNAKVDMNKIEKLKTGDNELIIKVIAEDGTEEKYKIIIYKYTASEETTSLIVGLGLIGGMSFGTYYVCKKIFTKIKKKVKNN